MTQSSYLSDEEFQQLTQNWKEFKTELFGSSFTAMDYAVAGFIGIVATGVHEIMVCMPNTKLNQKIQLKKGVSLNTDGILKEQVSNTFDKVLDKQSVKKLEKLHKVSFDQIKGHKLAGPNHRARTLGHDPIFGLIFGVRDIMNGELTKMVNGQFIVEKTVVEPVSHLFEAVRTWAGHIVSDINTPQGVPMPGAQFVDWLSGGDFMDRTYQRGMDFRHLFAQAIPVILSDVLIRLYCLYKGYASSFTEAFSPIPNTKIRRMLLMMHATNLTANLVITFSLKGGNPTNINWAAVAATAWYSIQEAMHWIVGRWKAIDYELERRDDLINGWVNLMIDESKASIRQSTQTISEYDSVKQEYDNKSDELAKLLGITL
ncbi:hypothetical protein P3628_06830 [Vibrio parahaemolyticus]|nr:hypothetical protein [Vibrio parahaemolyticus]MDF5263644.1 hypothetical protein [Vibrio parahaemolyticus]MDF5268371.1 hypothetical protein [Vibrio parahaemolyticus]